MIGILARAGRLLAAHWPALLAWFLAGTLGHFLILQLASIVGARTAIGGILLLPVAALSLLTAYVAMLLVLRDGMPTLKALAPLPDDGPARRAAFLNALMGGILPFVAFYTAWGFVRADVADYLNGVHEWLTLWGLQATVGGLEFDSTGTGDQLGFDAITITILVLAYLGRWAHKRYRERLPKWTGIPAAYLEALWVYLAAYIVADLIGIITGWIDSRQAMVWLGDFRAGLVGVFSPLGFVWDGVEWFLGEAGGLMLLPLAWLTIAGVVYGQAVKATAPVLSGARIDRVRARYGSVPDRMRRRLGDFWGDLTGRFRPIGRALVLMWRAGPVLIGAYVLLFTLVTFGEQWLTVGLSRAIGPHPTLSFWVPMSGALVMIVTVLVEPVRIALISATYDRTLAELSPAESAAPAPSAAEGAADGEPQIDAVAAVVGGQHDDEVAVDVAGEQHRVHEVEPDRPV